MYIKKFKICDCSGAVGHNDSCVRKAWNTRHKIDKAYLKFEINSYIKELKQEMNDVDHHLTYSSIIERLQQIMHTLL